MGVGKWIFVSACAICMLSCSTTRVLQDGEFRLAKNKVEVTNDKSFNTGQIEPYLKQKPNSYFIFGWNPFLNIYNWSNGKGKGWDRFVQKIGVAPVVYDPEMVGSSVENITRHLEYLGYFHSTVDTKIEVKKRKVYVGYYVTLGKQYPVKSLIINVPDGEFAEEFYKDTVSLAVRKGVPLSESLLEDESEKLDSITTDEETIIFALSSQEPSSDDWIPFTAYPYRESRQFTTSEWFKENGYIDVYRATHYSAETDSGITRESGDVFERMDFIYVKNAIPLSSVTFSVAGMTNRAIYAEVLIP